MPTRILINRCDSHPSASVTQGREPPTYCKECRGVHWIWKCSTCGLPLRVEHIIPDPVRRV